MGAEEAAERPDPLGFGLPHDVGALEGLGGGLGGRLRETPGDFRVEEIPLLRPSGRGDHTLVQIEKRGIPTFDVLLFLSKQIKISERRIGYAGLKDSRAVARQWLSFPKIPPERFARVRHRTFRVITAARHGVGLKIGHLLGNRFTIRIRDADVSRIDAARRVMERVLARGLPGAYGAQRFGTRLDGHLLGRAVVEERYGEWADQLLGRPSPLEGNPVIREARTAYDEGDLEGARHLFPRRHRAEKRALGVLSRGGTPQEAFEAIPPAQRRIWVSAWQSYAFNRVLAERIEADTFDRLLPGDIGQLAASGARFTSDGGPGDRRLVESRRGGPTGPLLGYDMRFAEGEPGVRERAWAESLAMDPAAFRAPHVSARGGRRPLAIRVLEGSVEVTDARTVTARFVLPPGAFATVLMDLLMRPSGVRGSE